MIILSILLVFLAFMFGASIASFLGVVYDRHGTGESINGRSHCFCGRLLKTYENVPVFGWLRIKGRTRCCNKRLPLWMLISECILGIAFAAPVAVWVFGY